MKFNTKIVWFLGGVICLVGCSKHPDQIQKSWLSVESPPTRVMIIADKDKMSQDFMCRVIRETKRGEFKDYAFNPTTSVMITGSTVKSTENTSSASNTTTLDIGKKE